MKLNPGPKWHIAHILTSEEIIYDFHGYFCKQLGCLYIKRQLIIWCVINNIFLTHYTRS